MKLLDSITDLMDLSKLREIVEDKRVLQSMGFQRVQHDSVNEQ